MAGSVEKVKASYKKIMQYENIFACILALIMYFKNNFLKVLN
jgi:hypothetical protein